MARTLAAPARPRRLSTAAAQHTAGGLARLPAGRLRMAGAPGALGRGRLPGRRHGARQDLAGAGPDPGARAERPHPRRRSHVRLHELDQRSAALRAHLEHQTVRQRRPRRHAGHIAALRRGGGQLWLAAAGSDHVCRRTLAYDRARRSAGNQEWRHQALASRDGLARRFSHGGQRHAAGKPPGRIVESVPLHQPRFAGHARPVQFALRRSH